MAVQIVAAFQNAGAPATGLAATIRVRRIDTGALVVTDSAMTELGDGLYSFDFTSTFDETLDYAIRADGTATLADVDRYKFGSLDANSFQTDELHQEAFNRKETDPGAGTITVYERDSSTVLRTGALFEDLAATQTYQGLGADRRNRMT